LSQVEILGIILIIFLCFPSLLQLVNERYYLSVGSIPYFIHRIILVIGTCFALCVAVLLNSSTNVLLILYFNLHFLKILSLFAFQNIAVLLFQASSLATQQTFSKKTLRLPYIALCVTTIAVIVSTILIGVTHSPAVDIFMFLVLLLLVLVSCPALFLYARRLRISAIASAIGSQTIKKSSEKDQVAFKLYLMQGLALFVGVASSCFLLYELLVATQDYLSGMQFPESLHIQAIVSFESVCFFAALALHYVGWMKIKIGRKDLTDPQEAAGETAGTTSIGMVAISSPTMSQVTE